MTNVHRTASAISAVTMAVAAVLTPAAAHADGHQVTYTVTSPNNVTANVSYVNADPSKFSTSVQAPLSGGTPVTYAATLANPNQFASITASGMLHWPDSSNGPAQFHCEIAVDGQVVVQQDATTTVTCRPS
nr:hypothetical protein [Mycobacterium lepraemurium]